MEVRPAKKVAFVLTAAVLLLAAGRPVSAEPETGQLMVRKLWRGFVNTTTGWTEVGFQMGEVQEEQGWKGTLTGLGRGFVYALGRTTSGIYEIVTFPIPIPENYRTIIHPEFRFTARPTRPVPVEVKSRPAIIQPRVTRPIQPENELEQPPVW